VQFDLNVVVSLVGRDIICMHASEDDVALRDLPSSCTKTTHTSLQFVVVVVVSCIVWLVGIEPACTRRGCTSDNSHMAAHSVLVVVVS
jgi:hypothetical protein